MSAEVIVPSIIIGLILLGIALVAAFFVIRFIVPRFIGLGVSIFYFIVSSFFDIRYLIFMSLAFATLAVHIGNGWEILASLCSIYLVVLSLIYALIFGAKVFGKDIFEYTKNAIAESDLSEDNSKQISGYIDAIKFNVGVIALLGGFAGCILGVTATSDITTLSAFNIDNTYQLGVKVAFDSIVQVATFGFYETQTDAQFTNLSPPAKLAQRTFILVLSLTLFGLVGLSIRQIGSRS